MFSKIGHIRLPVDQDYRRISVLQAKILLTGGDFESIVAARRRRDHKSIKRYVRLKTTVYCLSTAADSVSDMGNLRLMRLNPLIDFSPPR